MGVSKPSPRPRFIPPAKVPLLPAEKLASRQVARTRSSPYAREAPADPDTSIRMTCSTCFATYIATAGRTAEQNLAIHVEEARGPGRRGAGQPPAPAREVIRRTGTGYARAVGTPAPALQVYSMQSGLGGYAVSWSGGRRVPQSLHTRARRRSAVVTIVENGSCVRGHDWAPPRPLMKMSRLPELVQVARRPATCAVPGRRVAHVLQSRA